MGSMYYCIFENTSSDLATCLDKLRDGDDDLTPEEKAGRRSLIALCKEIVRDYGDDE